MNTNGQKNKNGFSAGITSLNSSSKSRSDELVDLKRFYSIVKRYIWLIVICAIVGTGIAYYLAFEYYLPVYQSSSLVLIENNAESFPGGSNEMSRIISSSYNLTSNQTVESEIQFLKSRELSEEVAKQISNTQYLPDGELYPILWADYPEDSTVVSVETVASRIRSGLIVEPVEKGSNILSVSFESYSPHEASRVVNASLSAYKEITAEKKRASAQSALEYLEKKRNEYQENLERAENQLSGFKNNENLVAIESQTNNLVNTVSTLEGQKQEIQIQLESVKSGIDNLENQLNAIKPGLGEKYSEAVGPRITQYQKELANLETQRLTLLSNNPQLKNSPNSEPKLRQLNTRISDLKAEIKRLTDNLLSDESGSLGILAGSDGNVTQEISNIHQKLTQLRLERGQLEAQLQAINNRLNNNQAFLEEVPENQKQLERLKREVGIYEELFLSVNKQASEVSIWEQTRRGAGTIIDYATVPNDPVKPQKILWLIGGLLLGLFLPVGFLVTKESLNDKINSIDALKALPYPLLAIIYDHSILDKKKTKKLSDSSNDKNDKISEDLIIYHYGLSPIAESYRSLVSKILYSNPDSPPKTLLLTSPGAGEGKTTLTANMAAALTEVGKRVLIIDCDMRKPAISKFFGVSREPGIMEVLFKNQSLEEAVRNTSIPGLDILTTGKKQPARPTSVIGSQSFRKMIEKFKFDYDFILLDSAPFGIIGDVAPILQLTDGVIINSKFTSTKQIELQHTINELENNSAKILGLVLNNYNPKKSIDDSDVKGLYNYLYSGYYDYHETKTKRKKTST